MNKDEKRAFLDFIGEELGRVSGLDPIEELRRIAMNSSDVRARLQSIRMLASELMSAEPPPPPSDRAKWGVVVISPDDPRHQHYGKDGIGE